MPEGIQQEIGWQAAMMENSRQQVLIIYHSKGMPACGAGTAAVHGGAAAATRSTEGMSAYSARRAAPCCARRHAGAHAKALEQVFIAKRYTGMPSAGIF